MHIEWEELLNNGWNWLLFPLYIYNSVHTLTGQPSNQCTEAATIMHVGGHTRKLGCLFRGSTATLNELCDHNN